MAPFDGSAGGQDRPARTCGSSVSLKLEFSKAADHARIDDLFEPALKIQTDPRGYVIRRLDDAFHGAVASGAAVMLSDVRGNVQALTIAYRCADYTELGTTMARLPGYHSASLVVAALALKEWLNNPPREKIVAEIRNENGASIKAYRDTLGWEHLPGRELSERIFADTDRTVADEKDKCGNVDDALEFVSWYECGARALATQARILLSFMDRGGLLNKHTNDFIPVDFTALDNAGLTRQRLEALAAGETSRSKIRAIP